MNSPGIVFAIALIASGTIANAQVNIGVEAGSAESLRLQAQSLQLAARNEADRAKDVQAIADGKVLFGAHPNWLSNGYAGTLKFRQPSQFRIKDWGSTQIQFKIISVISPTECLVIPHQYSAEPFLLRGVTTARAADNMIFVFQHPVLISDTYTYNTVGGARKTILVLDASKIREIDQLATNQKNESDRAALVAQEAQDAITFRKWITTDNREYRGKLLFLKDSHLHLQTKSGETVKVRMVELIKSDQDYAKTELQRILKEKRPISPSKPNRN